MTVENPQARQSCRLSVVSHVSLVLALSLVLAACNKEQAAPESTGPAADTIAAPAVAPEAAVSAKVSAMTPDQLREAARTAYAENRLYAPAENNAVEYYLALRDKAPGDAAVSSALIDLLPMTVIATEQSVNRDDFAEAQRLVALLEKAEPQHPALARLKTNIGAKQQAAVQRAEEQVLSAGEQAAKQADLEKQRLADQKKQQEQAARQLAAKEATDNSAAEKAAADKAAADKLAADQRAADQRAAQARAAQQAAAQPTVADLRPLSTPAPEFPREAARAGRSGEVQVEFTVGTDGSVSNVRVVRSEPGTIFDRAAITAVRRWRFQPIASPLTTRRTIGFTPGR